MPPLGQFVHRLDPVLVDLGIVKLWWYGLAYCVGFIGIHLCLRRAGKRLPMTLDRVYDFTLLFVICVLLCGRAFEILVYERAYYARYPWQLLSFWRGGMASHGVLIGAMVGSWLFCRRTGFSLRRVLDELAIPAAFFLALGRIGNFINAEVYGSPTSGWWGVQFPHDDTFRHPVPLYDAIKNLALVPILLFVRRRHPADPGRLTAHFVFWYAFLRIFADYYRDDWSRLAGIGAGQYFNIAMALAGLVLIALFATQSRHERASLAAAAVGERSEHADAASAIPRETSRARRWKRAVFVGLLLLSLTIPGGWTRGFQEFEAA